MSKMLEFLTEKVHLSAFVVKVSIETQTNFEWLSMKKDVEPDGIVTAFTSNG